MPGETAVQKNGGFELIRSREIPSLQLSVEEYLHRDTGAQHFHFATDQIENVFMVAFRTVPEDSTGVAHILEHTTLCGSERFPVRDPFFLMIRRSLNTFMNAFTASDYTAYPFASENKQDFQNLLEIYLDAVFFPILDPLDFAQEGHRLEFSEPGNVDSELVLKGIVYNEMKGDQSSITSFIYEAIKSELFPTSTYHFNSGGDPEQIPNLSYSDLTNFHKKHYHPSNAIFMTSGDIDPEHHQIEFERLALKRFKNSGEVISVSTETVFESPKVVVKPYPVSVQEAEKKSHVVLAWKLGQNTDLEELIKCNLLSDVLLDTSASPLRLALENTDLAIAPSPLCGLEESNLELSFFCGLEGVDQEDADKVEALVIDTLKTTASNGIAHERIEACLHQLELSHREIGGDGYPFGLQLMFSCLSAAVHRSDPIALLDLDQVLIRLRKEIQDPDFIPTLIRTHLLDNNHRVRLTMVPDVSLNQRVQDETDQALKQKLELMADQDKQTIVEQTAALEARQSREEPIHLLPKVGIGDIGRPRPEPISRNHSQQNFDLTEYNVATNGICYEQIVCELPNLSPPQQQLLQIYSQIVTEVGSADRNYLETQELQHAKTGGVGCYSSLRGDLADPNKFANRFVMSSRCLAENLNDMNQILSDTFLRSNFSERNRIADLIHQIRIRRDASISNNGHGLAMTAAGAWFRPVPRFNHGISGLLGLLSLRKIDDALKHEDELEQVLEDLSAINRLLSLQPRSLTLVSSESINNLESLSSPWMSSNMATTSLAAGGDQQAQYQAFRTTTQVNHCAEVYQTVPENHEDAPALAVLAGVLRNGFLHRAIREQGGAYGGGASHDQSNGLFRFYSYRDPNVNETFDAFTAAAQWVQTQRLGPELVEEAILGIVSGIDAPGSPAGEAKQHYLQKSFGRTYEHRRAFREHIIRTDEEDIKRVAERYLNTTSSRAVITNHEQSLDQLFVDQVV